MYISFIDYEGTSYCLIFYECSLRKVFIIKVSAFDNVNLFAYLQDHMVILSSNMDTKYTNLKQMHYFALIFN